MPQPDLPSLPDPSDKTVHPSRQKQRKYNAALALKMSGATWEDICDVIGYPTVRSARIAVERALERQVKDDNQTQSHLRQLANVRLERLLRGVWAKAIDPNNPDHLVAMTKAREIIADHRKLFGLDAPTEMNINNPGAQELEQYVNFLISKGTPALEEADIFDGEWEEEDEQDAVAT